MAEPVEQWRVDEHLIEGGWYAGEYPRLWPPRRKAAAEVDQEDTP